MRRFLTYATTLVLTLGFFAVSPIVQRQTFSLECKPGFTYSNQQELEQIKSLCEAKVNELRSKGNTLASQIQYMDTQIYLTTLRVQATEQQIKDTENEIQIIDKKIDGLDESLNQLSKILLERIVTGYKTQSVSLFNMFLDSGNASDFLNKVKYQKTTQDNNQKLLVQVQESKLNFEEQKQTREKKKIDLDKLKVTLDSQKVSLDNQKGEKRKLLEVTRNDEKTYQALLDKAQAEYRAIQAIVTGGGTETKLRDVKKGDTIASVIPGPSCNSGGGHLHFIVKQNGTVVNPFSFLKPVDYQNCSGSSCGSSDGDPFNPSGSWDWPLNPTIHMNQGYGSTWAVNHTWVGRIYNFHNGLDINGSSNDVKAVEDGTLYRGGFYGSNGCTLPYVLLKHANSSTETFYLHVYSQ